jgi:hypothetical protein
MPDSMTLDFHPKETCEKVPFNKKKSENIFHIKRFKDRELPEDTEQKEVRDPEREKKMINIEKLKKQLGLKLWSHK